MPSRWTSRLARSSWAAKAFRVAAFGHQVQADGTPLGFAFLLEADPDDQTFVTVARQGFDDDHFIAYTDSGSGSPDLYGKRFVPPIASFAAVPSSGTAPLTVQFTDTSTAPGGIGEWDWDFGDGGTSDLQNPQHQYTQTGIFAARLTIFSDGGADRTSMAITVTNPVTADFSADPLSGVLPLSVAFTDQSTTSSGTITSWLWDFADTGTSTLKNPVHQYAQAGTYTVSLTASNGTYGDGETKQDYIAVQDLPTTTITYSYDDLYRLTDAVYSSGEHFNYTYDAVGNAGRPRFWRSKLPGSWRRRPPEPPSARCSRRRKSRWARSALARPTGAIARDPVPRGRFAAGKRGGRTARRKGASSADCCAMQRPCCSAWPR